MVRIGEYQRCYLGWIFAPFFWMNRREVELEYAMMFIEHMLGVGLRSADDKIPPFFGLREGIQMSRHNEDFLAIEDNLDACRG